MYISIDDCKKKKYFDSQLFATVFFLSLFLSLCSSRCLGVAFGAAVCWFIVQCNRVVKIITGYLNVNKSPPVNWIEQIKSRTKEMVERGRERPKTSSSYMAFLAKQTTDHMNRQKVGGENCANNNF